VRIMSDRETAGQRISRTVFKLKPSPPLPEVPPPTPPPSVGLHGLFSFEANYAGSPTITKPPVVPTKSKRRVSN
jgi:hypothetical protein